MNIGNDCELHENASNVSMMVFLTFPSFKVKKSLEISCQKILIIHPDRVRLRKIH